MIGLLSLSVTSCGMSGYVKAIKDKVVEYQKKKRENDIQEIVMNAIIDRDVEPIYKRLCKQLKDRKDIKRQLQGLINFFDSGIVSWKRGYKEVMSKSVSDGKLTKEYDAWEIRHIKTKKREGLCTGNMRIFRKFK